MVFPVVGVIRPRELSQQPYCNPDIGSHQKHGDTLEQLQGHSITYRIAMGPQAGRKVLTLQTITAREEDDFGTCQLGRIGGFSLHAGVAGNTRERKKLERICRYIYLALRYRRRGWS